MGPLGSVLVVLCFVSLPLSRAAAADAEAEQQRIAQLGPQVLEFIDRCDEAARAGNESAQRGALRAKFDALYGPLNGIYQGRNSALEGMSRAIMDQDGDLEALYESPEFRQSQAVAAQALYYLNWLNYYGARLQDGARRKELLAAAEKGFSEFAGGDQNSELITESLLGRGLCQLELADYDGAVRDFKLVIDDPKVSAERKAKARLAILDAYARAGRIQDALRYSNEILSSGGGGADTTLIRFYRLQALFDAEEKSSGADADRYRREATSLMEQLRRAGKGWADKVDALMVSRIDDPAKWAGKAESPTVKWELARMMLAKNDAAGATPWLEELVAAQEADAKPFQPEAHYWLGVVRFKANDFPAAAAQFDAALATPGGEWAGEARYLRFKSLEAMMAQQADQALGERYVAALTDFLANQPDHAMAYEARYRLGEWRQSGGQFVEAIDEYAKVGGDPSFVLRARFGTLQSRFELLKTDVDPQARTARLDAIGQDLDKVESQAKELKGKLKETNAGKGKDAGKDKGAGTDQEATVAFEELEAKSTLLRAVYVSLRGQDGDAQVAALLADFDTRFPSQTELLPQALRLQLGALLALNRFADAEQVVAKHGSALASESQAEAVEGLAASYAKAGARRKAEGDAAGGEAASRVALALYDLPGGAGGSEDLKKKLARARLYEQTNDWQGAITVYESLLKGDPESQLALRGLARAEEARGKNAEALAHWVTYTGKTKPGDLGWYQGQYQQARLQLAGGDKARSCETLTKLKPAMPGLSDADLRNQLNELYAKACG